jgi:hypothetical protein
MGSKLSSRAMQMPPPLPPQRPPDWWGRNWKWCVPLLCLAGVAVLAGFVLSIMMVIKSSDAYTGAVARAKAAPAVVDALGTPIQPGLFVLGKVQMSGNSGTAILDIPIAGPKGKATVHVNAEKAGGEWHFNRLVVEIRPTGKRIDLSEKRSGRQNGPAGSSTAAEKLLTDSPRTHPRQRWPIATWITVVSSASMRMPATRRLRFTRAVVFCDPTS